jgi:DNA-binding NarL/FixJ family response regulator
MPITVAIVEDEPSLLEMLTRMVTKAPQFTLLGGFPNGEEALAALPALSPDVVVMDLQLPGMNGIECTGRLRRLLPKTQVVIFTVFMDSDRIFKALSAGACGYLLKRTPRAEMILAIEQVHQGGAPMSAEIAEKVIELLHRSNPATPASEPDGQLTAREEEVLKLLADGIGTKAISVQLEVSLETVRFHLKNIYQKLHVRSQTEAVRKYLK